MKVYDSATEAIKQGGKRRGANMAVLRVDHPDILDFVRCKEKLDQLNNFNISVGLTEAFMEAVEADKEYNLIHPNTGEVVRRLPAREVFELIVLMAWGSGEPGMLFLDRINKDNPTPHIGEIESTNPCGEQPLLPYESCNLGSLNLAKMVKEQDGQKGIDGEKLRKIVRTAVHFLDNVIEMNNYPLPEIDKMTKDNRKIGLGVMGFADMLLQLGIPYNSEEGVALADKVMGFINAEAKKMSQELAVERGPFPNFKGSTFDQAGEPPIRNSTRTTIAPTGTISMIAEASGGVEPLFSVCYMKRVMDGTELIYANKYFEQIAKEKGFYSTALMKKIANIDTVQHIEEIPEEVRKYVTVAHDTTPEWHIKMQAAFQRHCDNAVSKTVNFPNTATSKDVEDVYMLAYKLGCKGVTIYRDGSRDGQVLNIISVKKEEKEKHDREVAAQEKAAQGQQVQTQPVEQQPQEQSVQEQQQVQQPAEQQQQQLQAEPQQATENDKDLCPECSAKMIFKEGCASCSQCSYSVCS